MTWRGDDEAQEPIKAEGTDHEQMSENGEAKTNALKRSESNRYIAETLSLIKEILFVGVICCFQFPAQAGLGQCFSIRHVKTRFRRHCIFVTVNHGIGISCEKVSLIHCGVCLKHSHSPD